MKQSSTFYQSLLPVLLAFFCMGFVDMVGTATNYAQIDLNLDDTIANIFPSMVFFWFFIFAVPTGVLMGRIGQRKTVILGLTITAFSVSIPLFWYDVVSMMISFSLLGIGNTLLQVATNPLMSSIVNGNKLASYLTFGQFIKAIASFSTPLIATRVSLMFDDWRMIYPLFFGLSVVSIIWLGATKIEENREKEQRSGFLDSFRLLGNPVILFCFLGIMCHVGIDVGTNITSPRILMERLNLTDLNEANYATSIYFALRTIGCLVGAFILVKVSSRRFFGLSVLCMITGMTGLFLVQSEVLITICIGLIGFGNANIFPIIMSYAMQFMPSKKNEISGLLIMGLIGGTLFPMVMGFATEAMGGTQIGALIVMSTGLFYLLFLSSKLGKQLQ